MRRAKFKHASWCLLAGLVAMAAPALALEDCAVGGPAAADCKLPAGGYATPSPCDETHTTNCFAEAAGLVLGDTSLVTQSGALRWADGKTALTCLKYRDAPTGYEAGTSSGTYWIDPDGGSTGNAVKAYCDMAGDGGGWTLIISAMANSPGGWSGQTGAYNAGAVESLSSANGKLADATINLIKTERYRLDRIYPAAGALYWSGGCPYAQNQVASGPCAQAFSDLALTAPLITESNGSHAGLAAWGNGNCPGGGNAHYAITSHLSSDTWWVGTAPSGGCPLTWGSTSLSSPTSQFRVWAR